MHTYIQTYPARPVHSSGDDTVSESAGVCFVASTSTSATTIREHTRYLAVMGHVQAAHLLECVHRMHLHTYIHKYIHTYIHTHTYIHKICFIQPTSTYTFSLIEASFLHTYTIKYCWYRGNRQYTYIHTYTRIIA